MKVLVTFTALLALAAAMGDEPSQASLVSSYRTIRPGQAFDVALRVQMKPGWHIYWKNPGESGLSPTIAWNLPKGWTASPIQWPTPERLDVATVVTYSYEKEALLLMRLTPPKGTTGPVMLRAKAKWLVCREGCLPAEASLALPLKIAASAVPDPTWNSALRVAQAKLPKPSADYTFRAWRSDKVIDLEIQPRRPELGLAQTVAFFPADEIIEPSAKQSVNTTGAKTDLKLQLSQYAPTSVGRLRGLLVAPKGATLPTGTDAITIDIPIETRKL